MFNPINSIPEGWHKGGRPQSEERKVAMRERFVSEETGRKISATKKGRIMVTNGTIDKAI